MTDIQTIQFLWRYMVHADQQITAAIATVSDEGYQRPQDISWGSLQKLVGHCITGQKLWLRRLRGEQAVYTDEPLPAKDAIAQLWAPVHADLLAYADKLTPADLLGTVRFRNRAGADVELPNWGAMLQIADHATYHRAQLNTMIKHAGGTPSPIMLYLYTAKS